MSEKLVEAAFYGELKKYNERIENAKKKKFDKN